MAERRLSSPHASPSAPTSPAAESSILRIVATPILFISFLVSLLMIDRQTYRSILGQHVENEGYYHSHQRKLAKKEFDDAFQMRSKVMAAMAMGSAICLAVVCWGAIKAWDMYFGRLPPAT